MPSHSSAFIFTLCVSTLVSTEIIDERRCSGLVVSTSGSSGGGGVKGLSQERNSQSQLRDQLVLFNISRGSGDDGDDDDGRGIVSPAHRAGLIPLLARVAYGRMIARGGHKTRSSKDSPSSRRAAVMSFVAQFDGTTELQHFVYMMLRSFVPMRETLCSTTADGSTALAAAANVCEVSMELLDAKMAQTFRPEQIFLCEVEIEIRVRIIWRLRLMLRRARMRRAILGMRARRARCAATATATASAGRRRRRRRP